MYKINNCKCMMNNNGAVRCGEAMKKYNEDAGCTLHMIGFKDNSIMYVCGYNWSIVKFENNEFEHLGKIDCTLRDINNNPNIILKGAKVMSIKEIEEKLGHSIIVREYKK